MATRMSWFGDISMWLHVGVGEAHLRHLMRRHRQDWLTGGECCLAEKAAGLF